MLALFLGMATGTGCKRSSTPIPSLPTIPSSGFEYALSVEGLPEGSELSVKSSDGNKHNLLTGGGDEVKATSEDAFACSKDAKLQFSFEYRDKAKKTTLGKVPVDILETIKLLTPQQADRGKVWTKQFNLPTLEPTKVSIHVCEKSPPYENPVLSNDEIPSVTNPAGSSLLSSVKHDKQALEIPLDQSGYSRPTVESSNELANSLITFLESGSASLPNKDWKEVKIFDLVDSTDYQQSMLSNQLSYGNADDLLQNVTVSVQNMLVSDKIALSESRLRYPGELLSGLDLLKGQTPITLPSKTSSGTSLFKPLKCTLNLPGGSAAQVTSKEEFNDVIQKVKEAEVQIGGIHSLDFFTYLSERQFANRIGASLSVGPLSIGGSTSGSEGKKKTTVAVVFRQIFYTASIPKEETLESRINKDLTEADLEELFGDWRRTAESEQPAVAMVDTVDFGAMSILLVESEASAEEMIRGLAGLYDNSKDNVEKDAKSDDTPIKIEAGVSESLAKWLGSSSMRLFLVGMSPDIFNDSQSSSMLQAANLPDLKAPAMLGTGQTPNDPAPNSYRIVQGNINPPALGDMLVKCFYPRPGTSMAWKHAEPIGYSCVNLLTNRPFYLASVGPVDYRVSIPQSSEILIEIKQLQMKNDGDGFLFFDRDGDWHFAFRIGEKIETSGLRRIEIDGGDSYKAIGADKIGRTRFKFKKMPKSFDLQFVLAETDKDDDGINVNAEHFKLNSRWDDGVSIVGSESIDLQDILTNGTPLNKQFERNTNCDAIAKALFDPSVRLALEVERLEARLDGYKNSNLNVGGTGVSEFVKEQSSRLDSLRAEPAFQAGVKQLQAIRSIPPEEQTAAIPAFIEKQFEVSSPNLMTKASISVKLVIPSQIPLQLAIPPSKTIK